MSEQDRMVTSVDELVAATADAAVHRITVRGTIENAPTIRLQPGQQLIGDREPAGIAFRDGSDGLQLTTDNEVRELSLRTAPEARAISNDTTCASLGQLVLADVSTIGQVQILGRDNVRGGHVSVRGLDVVAADARERSEQPEGFGVKVLQGAFTLWNQHADPDIALSAELVGISAGREGAPVRGSGIFVSGGGFEGGPLRVTRLETGPVFTDGGIPEGTAGVITGGVFVLYAAEVALVVNRGPVTTLSTNDMALDNWGTVRRWIAEEAVTTHGPSGVGFVNFGEVGELHVQAPIETFGLGARGFNVYDGSIGTAAFERITTHGDGSVGIQVSKPLDRLIVRRGIETHGGIGETLVKGVITELPAVGLSVKPGGAVGEVDIAGGIISWGPGITPLEVHGEIGTLRVTGGLRAAGSQEA
jgi:hypothetical protein